jgi:serine/threonine-protein kinase
MDETEVTNHQYVTFLNQALSRVRVEEDVVKSNGHVWMLLGEVSKGYEPIVFRDGRFFVKDPRFHSHPAVRITGYGATEYARFYSRRLPSEVEWLRARMGKAELPAKALAPLPYSTETPTGMESMHKEMHSDSTDQETASRTPLPVVQARANDYGIRGLDENVSEWALRLQTGAAENQDKPEFVILPTGVKRHPWEASEEVGFRTVLSVAK